MLWRERDLQEEIDHLRWALRLARDRIAAWQGAGPDELIDLIDRLLATGASEPIA